MKLDNKGWGLNTLLICIAIILVALLVSVFYIYKMSKELSKQLTPSTNTNYTEEVESIDNYDTESYYKDKEQELSTATNKYILSIEDQIESNKIYTINIETLISNGYIEEITDKKTNTKCNAYSTVEYQYGLYNINSYIACDNYVTENYGEY